MLNIYGERLVKCREDNEHDDADRCGIMMDIVVN